MTHDDYESRQVAQELLEELDRFTQPITHARNLPVPHSEEYTPGARQWRLFLARVSGLVRELERREDRAARRARRRK